MVVSLFGCISEKTEESSSDSTILNVGATFSIDGTKAIYSSNSSGSGAVYSIDLTSGTIPTLLTGGFGDSWTTRGCAATDGINYLYETNGSGSFVAMSVDSTTSVTRELLANNMTEYRHISYSPDGLQVAYTKKTISNNWYKIFINHADVSAELQLSQGEFHDFKPSWSSTGKVVFHRFINGKADLILIDVSDPNLTEVNLTNTATIDEFDPVFANNSETIYFAKGSLSDNSIIASMSSDGTNLKTIFSDSGHYQDIAISKGDSKLLFTFQQTGGNFDLYYGDVSGTVIRQITLGKNILP